MRRWIKFPLSFGLLFLGSCASSIDFPRYREVSVVREVETLEFSQLKNSSSWKKTIFQDDQTVYLSGKNFKSCYPTKDIYTIAGGDIPSYIDEKELTEINCS